MSEPIQNPWKMVPTEEGLRFEATFPLPNDGAGPNTLVVRVEMESATSNTCDVYIIGRTFKDTPLGSFTTYISVLGNVLYGFASIKHVAQLVVK